MANNVSTQKLVNELDKAEDKLRASIKELNSFNVLITGTNAYLNK